MLVVLRLALGWHFLYEGVWKITHHDAFVAETEGFLSGARGPAAKLFYRMVPDLDGHRRLEHDLAIIEITDADGNTAKHAKLAKSWDEVRQRFVAYYQPVIEKGEDMELHRQLNAAAGKVYQRHVHGLDEFLKDNGDKIDAHFASLQRFEEDRKGDPNTDFMRQRRWDQMQELRKEAKGWIADLDARESALKADLLDLLNKDRKPEVDAVAAADTKQQEKEAAEKAKKPEATPAKPQAAAAEKADGKSNAKPNPAVEAKPSDPPRDIPAGPKAKAKSKETVESGSEEFAETEEVKQPEAKQPVTKKKSAPAPAKPQAVGVVDFSPLAEGHDPAGPFARSSNPFRWPWIEQLATLLTYALFAIGLCLMLGLFTRLSALAGAGFMLFVVLSQPSYPGVYPLDPPQLGHALLVNKDFVEMIALLVIASTNLGRWTGLDFFLHNFLIKPFCRCCCCCKAKAAKEGEKA